MRNEDKGGEYEQMILSMSDDVEYIGVDYGERDCVKYV
jgi:hypothetical protein